jgi:hypothetical protein
MKRLAITLMTTAVILMMITAVKARIITYDRDVNYAGQINHDRYLDVEIWTDDDEYYEGDNIRISFRANRDCFVAIYNIDTRGRVNLIFPADEYDDNRIDGDQIYTIPGRYDDFDLTVQGPEGIEYLHIIAAKRPFDIPGWIFDEGMVCHDDPYDFINYIDANYFGGERNMRRAFDVTSFYVEEWHQYYFRPIYVDYHHHHRPYWDWGLYGSVYVDYPWGATIYIDGVYWGIAPLYIPRIYYGWHYITVYDHYGYCWEDRIEVVKTRAVVLNETRIKTRSGVKSRFKEVRAKGYLNPERNGYPSYKTDKTMKMKHKPISKTARILKNNIVDDSKYRQEKRSAFEKSRKSGNEYKSGKRTSKTYNSGKRSTSKSTIQSDKSRKERSTGKSSKTFKSHKSSGLKKSGSADSKKSSKSSGSYKSKSSKSSSKSSTKSDRKSTAPKKKSSGKSSSSSKSLKKSSSKTASSADVTGKKLTVKSSGSKRSKRR